jgi:hypothetical protein
MLQLQHINPNASCIMQCNVTRCNPRKFFGIQIVQNYINIDLPVFLFTNYNSRKFHTTGTSSLHEQDKEHFCGAPNDGDTKPARPRVGRRIAERQP